MKAQSILNSEKVLIMTPLEMHAVHSLLPISDLVPIKSWCWNNLCEQSRISKPMLLMNGIASVANFIKRFCRNLHCYQHIALSFDSGV
jgi:hypothetical protein